MVKIEIVNTETVTLSTLVSILFKISIDRQGDGRGFLYRLQRAKLQEWLDSVITESHPDHSTFI